MSETADKKSGNKWKISKTKKVTFYIFFFLILRRPHENTKGKLCKYQWKFRLNECITGEIPKPT